MRHATTNPDNERIASGSPKDDHIPLSSLREGDRGWLRSTNLCCDDCELLNAMGLTEHCEIRVCRYGEPCIVQVNATRLGLSAALARNIFVSMTAASQPQ